MSEARRITHHNTGQTILVPLGTEVAIVAWLRWLAGAGPIGTDAIADDMARMLHDQGLAIVPLTFASGSTQTVDVNVYTQALTWKHEAERRAAAAEAELAELREAFVLGPRHSDAAHDHDAPLEWRGPGEDA